MRDLSSLPDEVLKLVMQHVPLKARLTSCCLVNKRLHAAATAATQQLVLGFCHAVLTPSRAQVLVRSSEQAQSALCWLDHYGHHLACLKINNFPQPLQQLPCPNLLELVLGGACRAQLGPAADGSPGVIQGCTKLTMLELCCTIIDAPAVAVLHDSLSSLVHLQHLSVEPEGGSSEGYCVGCVSDTALSCLTHLTHLSATSLSRKNLAQLGGLTNLQELILITVDDDSITVGPHNMPGLVFPASLTRFGMMDALFEARTLSLLPAGLRDLDIGGTVEDSFEDRDLVLSHMAHLQQLTRIEFYLSDWPAPGPGYASLTASSSLVWLGLSHGSLPAGVWPHVFPATRKMPHLTCLDFADELDNVDVPSAWGAADVSSLVSCCPSMCSLNDLILQHGVHISELHKLTALTKLHVRYAVSDVQSFHKSLEGLAAVSNLAELSIALESPDLPVAALLPLTSLTALTRFHCCFWRIYRQTEYVGLHAAASQTAVWLQLLERCAAEPGCQPTALRSLAQQLAEQKAMVVCQQQQIAHLQGQQEQQLLAQQQVAAAQGARIATLEGRLQQLMQRLPPQ